MAVIAGNRDSHADALIVVGIDVIRDGPFLWVEPIVRRIRHRIWIEAKPAFFDDDVGIKTELVLTRRAERSDKIAESVVVRKPLRTTVPHEHDRPPVDLEPAPGIGGGLEVPSPVVVPEIVPTAFGAAILQVELHTGVPAVASRQVLS